MLLVGLDQYSRVTPMDARVTPMDGVQGGAYLLALAKAEGCKTLAVGP